MEFKQRDATTLNHSSSLFVRQLFLIFIFFFGPLTFKFYPVEEELAVSVIPCIYVIRNLLIISLCAYDFPYFFSHFMRPVCLPFQNADGRFVELMVLSIISLYLNNSFSKLSCFSEASRSGLCYFFTYRFNYDRSKEVLRNVAPEI